MNCCNSRTEGTNRFFSRFSKSYARTFRRKGLEKSQRYLLEGIKQAGIKDQKILDIGCGVGALHLTLLKEGAARARGVDISEGMLEQARDFARTMALQDRVNYTNGDFVQIADSLEAADITILDRVICCYEDVESLVNQSTAKTGNLYALSYPRDVARMRIPFKIHIFFAKLLRFKFHPFWHDWRAIANDITARGFTRVYENHTFLWDIAVYERH